MTKREICCFLSKMSGFPASHIDIERLCKENNFKAYDIDYIEVVNFPRRYCFNFKKYSKYCCIFIPCENLFDYLFKRKRDA